MFNNLRIMVLLLAGLLTGCSVQQSVIRGLADELSADRQAGEDDLELVREASAYHLKLSEAVLRHDPGHTGLATAVTAGFTQYAYAFVAFDADRIEAVDVRAAQKLRERAARLYRRAHSHAMTALEKQHPGFAAALAEPDPTKWPKIDRSQVELAYWTAASWGGLISLGKDNPDTVADLPLAVRLATLAWEVDPGFGIGALSSLMGSFESSRPGGSTKRALAYFEQGISLSAGKSVGALVAKAEGYALPAGDRAMFSELLEQALTIRNEPGSPLSLSNEVMRRRATWLLERTDELF